MWDKITGVTREIWQIVLIIITAWLVLRGIGTLLPEAQAVESEMRACISACGYKFE